MFNKIKLNKQLKDQAQAYTDLFNKHGAFTKLHERNYYNLYKMLINTDVENPSKELNEYLEINDPILARVIREYFYSKSEIKQPIINILNKIDSGYFSVSIDSSSQQSKKYKIRDDENNFTMYIKNNFVLDECTSDSHKSLSIAELYAIYYFADNFYNSKKELEEQKEQKEERDHLTKLYG